MMGCTYGLLLSTVNNRDSMLQNKSVPQVFATSSSAQGLILVEFACRQGRVI